MIKNVLVLALLAMPALAGTPSKNPVTPPPPPPPAVLSYDNVSLGYGHGFGADSNAIAAGVQASLTNNIFAQAGLGFAGIDNNVFDNFSANISLGAHLPLTSSIDFVATAGVLIAVPDVGDDEAYFTSSAGFRGFLGPVDTFVGMTYIDVADGVWLANTSLWIPVANKLDIGIGAGLNVENTDDWSLSGGFRYRFK